MRNSRGRFTFVSIAVLLTLGILGTLSLFGDNLRRLFGASAASLAGERTVVNDAHLGHGMNRKLMRNFGANNVYGDSAPPAPSVSSATRARETPATFTGDTHAHVRPNPFTLTQDDALSTFAVDVDTASYAYFRRSVGTGSLPSADSVRVEEWVNYFRYRLPPPTEGNFRVDLEGAPSPFTAGRHLIKVGLQARNVSKSQRKPMHLVFLVDTSGSMSGADRLDLAKRAMHLAVDGLNETDTVAVVTYAGSVREVLGSTPASQREAILSAIDSLNTGGGTAMGSGLELAYRNAAKHVAPGVVSRVIVLTDGDTNIGPNLTGEALLSSVHGYVKEGVTLSTIGFGMGNYRDDLMEALADKGNGNCFYIDSEREARRVFQERLTGTLEVVAQDVKVQVDFDKTAVRGYRLLGYENRNVADKDFRNDKVDAGEVGAGHTVTALYEVELTGEGTHVATVRVRAKQPGGVEASEQRFGIEREQLRASLDAASKDLRFAAAVAGTADVLRGAKPASDWSLATAEALAEGAVDDLQDRAEFVTLLRRVRQLRATNVSSLGQNTY
jgi:Ca-activated chloride channel family protein